LDAHGSWDPGSKPAYALVPANSKLLFFSENLKLFLDSDQARNQLLGAEPNQTVEGYKWAQNYTVTPVTTDDYITPAGMVRKTVDARKLLCTSDACGQKGWHDPAVCKGLFAEDDYQQANIYFVACRYVKLKEAGSPEYYAETGVNQRQTSVGYQDGGQVDYALSNDGADMWLDKISSFSTKEEASEWYHEARASLTPDQAQMVRQRLSERIPGWARTHKEMYAEDEEVEAEDEQVY
jgi:hypothetical protein